MEEAGSSNLPKPILFRATNRRAKRVAVARKIFFGSLNQARRKPAERNEVERAGTSRRGSNLPKPTNSAPNNFVRRGFVRLADLNQTRRSAERREATVSAWFESAQTLFNHLRTYSFSGCCRSNESESDRGAPRSNFCVFANSIVHLMQCRARVRGETRHSHQLR